MNQLQKALTINAIFSSFSGIALILLHQSIARLFGTQNNAIFWVTGTILLYFASTIIYEIKKQRRLAVLWIIIQDFSWVLGSLILLLFQPFQITLVGNLTIGIIAIIVLFMGINQAKFLPKKS